MSEIFVSSSHGSLTELICRRKLWVGGYVGTCEECSRTSGQKRGEVGKGFGKSQAATPVTEPQCQTQKQFPVLSPDRCSKKLLAFLATHMLPSMPTNCYPDTFPVGAKRSPSFLILFLPLLALRVLPVYITVY